MAQATADPRRWKALAVLGIAYLMVVLDVSIVNVALPSIQEELDFSTEDLQWVISAYALTFGGFLLLGGRMGDLLGRRTLFMIGLALFSAFSLLCGFSTSSGMLIAARALQPPAPALSAMPTDSGAVRAAADADMRDALAVDAAPIAEAPAAEKRDDVLTIVRGAINSNRIDLYLQPIVTLPQRKVRFYEAVSRIRTERGEVIQAADFIAQAESGGLMPKIDNLLILRCVQVIRRLLLKNREIGLFCNLSASTMTDSLFFPQFLEFMDANRAIAPSLVLEFTQSALRNMGPIENESLAALSERGFRFSLDNLTDRIPLLDVRFFATAVMIQRETGGNLSEILENLGHVVRERFKILRQVRVYTAHGRLTGYVLLGLPAFLGVALMFINPDHMNLLFRERMGQQMLMAAIIMQFVGYVWIKKVIKIEV